MTKLRDLLGTGSFLIMVVLIGVSAMFLFDINPTIATIMGFGITGGIFYVVDKMADLEVLSLVKTQQDAFNREFDEFKKRYSSRLESMPFLYKVIDNAQTHTLKFCNDYPNKYKDTKDFKKVTYNLMLSQLYAQISYDGSIYDNNYNAIRDFSEEILYKSGLYSFEEQLKYTTDLNSTIQRHNPILELYRNNFTEDKKV